MFELRLIHLSADLMKRMTRRKFKTMVYYLNYPLLLALCRFINAKCMKCFFGVENMNWTPIFIEMFSRKLDKLFIVNEAYENYLSRSDMSSLKMKLTKLDKQVWFTASCVEGYYHFYQHHEDTVELHNVDRLYLTVCKVQARETDSILIKLSTLLCEFNLIQEKHDFVNDTSNFLFGSYNVDWAATIIKIAYRLWESGYGSRHRAVMLFRNALAITTQY
ncbi:hypothetical protein PRIPAC_76839 [Pristionchus pacificus]|uniref:Uncharacterized protein n=1 Tax=Pristionchus pacificus TaxID=54126 RepID=A0A2A6BHR7_PRIPA|nr:hypothetical protein PRIPAC_76839 [Pristionchus pacificus]|eukprot:PDM65417.1 hypothetical protein PRIPAC_52359 [Pristionchus pacificus]